MSKSNIDHIELDLVDPDLLPPQIRQLVQIIGLADTFKLLEARGGTLFRIPFGVRGTLLYSIIDQHAADKLCKVWGNRTITLPKSDKVIKQLRNQAINNARRTKSLTQVATEFNLTRRHVINLQGDHDENPTADMFKSIPVDKPEK